MWPAHLVLRRPVPYTSRLSSSNKYSKQIESSLPGAIFDPYVRFIVYEGLRTWWAESIPEWLACPASGDPYPHSSNSDIPPSNPKWNALKSLASSALGLLPIPSPWSAFLADKLPLQEVDGFNQQLLALNPLSSSRAQAANAGDKTDTLDALAVCPFSWAKPLHSINCEYAWPKEYTGEHGSPLIELDTDKYLGAISRDNVLERVLAMAGVRLAHVLNFALGGEGGVYIDY